MFTSDEAAACDDTDEVIIATALGELHQHWQGLPLALHLSAEASLEDDAFHIVKVEEESFRITASSATGLLYAAYFVLRSQTMGDGCLCQTLGPAHQLSDHPTEPIRSVMVSDPALLEGRVTAFARAMASIGINQVVCPLSFQQMTGVMADSLRAYGIALCNGDASSHPIPLTRDANWTGDHLRQFDLYAFGRRLWQGDITPERMVCEWLAQTFSENPYFIISMRDAMLSEPDRRPTRLFDTWQEMQPYLDKQRYEEVESHLVKLLSAEK